MRLFDFFKRKVTKDEHKTAYSDSRDGYETACYDISEDVIENKDVYTIIEPAWWCINIYDGEAAYKRDLEQFATEQKHIFAIEWYITEVNNGGHDQFYFNSTGIVWEDAMQGFEAVGLKNNYEIIKESAEGWVAILQKTGIKDMSSLISTSRILATWMIDFMTLKKILKQLDLQVS